MRIFGPAHSSDLAPSANAITGSLRQAFLNQLPLGRRICRTAPSSGSRPPRRHPLPPPEGPPCAKPDLALHPKAFPSRRDPERGPSADEVECLGRRSQPSDGDGTTRPACPGIHAARSPRLVNEKNPNPPRSPSRSGQISGTRPAGRPELAPSAGFRWPPVRPDSCDGARRSPSARLFSGAGPRARADEPRSG